MPTLYGRRPSTDVEVSRFFPADLDAPGAARHFLAETLEQAGAADRIEEAKVVLTELATNAVLHARSPFNVSISVVGDRVGIAVRDQSTEPPAPRAASSTGKAG